MSGEQATNKPIYLLSLSRSLRTRTHAVVGFGIDHLLSENLFPSGNHVDTIIEHDSPTLESEMSFSRQSK